MRKLNFLLPDAAADCCLVAIDGAFAAALAAASQASAHCLNHLQASRIGRFAANAYAVRRHLARAVAAIEATFAATLAVLSAHNFAVIAFQIATHLVKTRTGALVYADAIDFASRGTLFETNIAYRKLTIG